MKVPSLEGGGYCFMIGDDADSNVTVWQVLASEIKHEWHRMKCRSEESRSRLLHTSRPAGFDYSKDHLLEPQSAKQHHCKLITVAESFAKAPQQPKNPCPSPIPGPLANTQHTPAATPLESFPPSNSNLSCSPKSTRLQPCAYKSIWTIPTPFKPHPTFQQFNPESHQSPFYQPSWTQMPPAKSQEMPVLLCRVCSCKQPLTPHQKISWQADGKYQDTVQQMWPKVRKHSLYVHMIWPKIRHSECVY